tara:strand:+ start:1621 stop:2226 length:606 start_codon:yes stop_codon:yes gene_type:complete
MIESLALKIKSGEIRDVVGVTTSFQGEVLASQLGIPLKTLSSVSEIDLAIDGADEVDPSFQLIKGGGACHVQEKLVASLAKRFIVVVDSSKLVEKLNLDFKLPVEVLPSAWKQVQKSLEELDGYGDLRMAEKKAGPVVTDQGNLIIDLTFKNGIDKPDLIESQINNIPGVLENGLFINLTDEVLVGRLENEEVVVKSLKKI